MILSSQTIRQQNKEHNIVTPFVERAIHEKTGMSFGLSQCGYDIRIKQDITLYPITLKNMFLNSLSVNVERPSFSLASTIEKFNLPNHLMFNVADKSSLARIGLAIQNTIAEPGWSGYLTLELNNQGPNIIKLYAGQPIAQVIFMRLDKSTENPYRGKYHKQGNFPQPAIFERLTYRNVMPSN